MVWHKHCVLASIALFLFGWSSLSFWRAIPRDPNSSNREHFRVKGATATGTDFLESRKPLHSYVSPVPEFERGDVDIRDLPAPLQIMEEYKKRHSVETLSRPDPNRRFAVAFYSCPLQAGNRLHHFMSGMLWSILTNRTVLWKYWDTETCHKYGSAFNQAICTSANTVQDCDAILARADWIPSYDEWAPQWALDQPVELPFYSTHPRQIVNGRYPWGPGNDEKVFGVDVKYDDRQVVVFAQTRFKITFLEEDGTLATLLHSREAREKASSLYSLGADFLFGMLLRESFSLTRAIQASVPESFQAASPASTYSVALHSRHILEQMDGCDIGREQKCIRQLLPSVGARRCQVLLMSDRSCTIERMGGWLQEQNCKVVVANHDTHKDYLSEHGPFSGAGFFQDLALASMAKSAFIGLHRSSSDLVLEMIEFNRRLDEWRHGEDPAIEEVSHCILKKIQPPGKIAKEVSKPRTGDDGRGDHECSCLNSSATKPCCERTVRRTHKMGFLLTREVIKSNQPYPAEIDVTQSFRNTSSDVDFRDVIFTRNWIESIISGYLYHKSGRECWLDPFGREVDYSWRDLNQNWSLLLQFRPTNPTGDRSLCQFLQDETVYEGMRAYIDVAFARWYDSLLENWRLSQLPEDENRTLFLCYEHLEDPSTREATSVRTLNWLFPRQDSTWHTKPEPEVYIGGHSTSHNATLRENLARIVVQLDSAVYDNMIRSLDKHFGCGLRWD